MTLWKRFLNWFKSDNPEEAYERGRQCVRKTLDNCKPEDLLSEADRLFDLCSGGFNTTASHHAFDRGVNDQLTAMGFDAPYTNGHF